MDLEDNHMLDADSAPRKLAEEIALKFEAFLPLYVVAAAAQVCAVCGSLWQCVAVCCCALLCVAVCCSVLQCLKVSFSI